MVTINPLSSRAIEIVVEGEVTRDDVNAAHNRLAELVQDTPELDVLADFRGNPSASLSAIAEEVRQLPLVIRVMSSLGRVAIIADEGWVRTVSRMESAAIPGVRFEVYERREGALARAWVLRGTDQPRPALP